VAVLDDPALADSISARAKAQPKAGQVVVEVDRVALAGGQREPDDRSAVEFHLCLFSWEA
jgi:hypothetical protein